MLFATPQALLAPGELEEEQGAGGDRALIVPGLPSQIQATDLLIGGFTPCPLHPPGCLYGALLSPRWRMISPRRAPGSRAVLAQLPLDFPPGDTFPFLPGFSLDCSPQTFGIPLFQVIANDRAHKQLQEAVRTSRRLCLEVEATVTSFRAQRQKKSPPGRSCGLVPCGVFPEEPLSPTFLDNSFRSRRRVRPQKRAALWWCRGLGEALTSAINMVPRGLFLTKCELLLLRAGSVLAALGELGCPCFPREMGWGVGQALPAQLFGSQGSQEDTARQPAVDGDRRRSVLHGVRFSTPLRRISVSSAANGCGFSLKQHRLFGNVAVGDRALRLQKFPPEVVASSGGSCWRPGRAVGRDPLTAAGTSAAPLGCRHRPPLRPRARAMVGLVSLGQLLASVPSPARGGGCGAGLGLPPSVEQLQLGYLARSKGKGLGVFGLGGSPLSPHPCMAGGPPQQEGCVWKHRRLGAGHAAGCRGDEGSLLRPRTGSAELCVCLGVTPPFPTNFCGHGNAGGLGPCEVVATTL